MANKDLFKQAIADAKSIREAAIANAKLALEESLTPQLKELLAQRLAEMEEEEAPAAVISEEEVTEEVAEESLEEAFFLSYRQLILSYLYALALCLEKSSLSHLYIFLYL